MQEIGRALVGEHRTDLRILDAGCGSGASLPWLSELAEGDRVFAMDIATPALLLCQQLDLPVSLVRASVSRLPYASDSFDLVVCADVLQHLSRPAAADALREIRRVLRAGGRALVRTNAPFGRQHLEDREDWRLYRPEGLSEEIETSGLRVERLTYANSVPALWGNLRRFPRRPRQPEAHSGETADGPGIPVPGNRVKDGILRSLLRLEARWLANPRRSLRFGHTLFALAVKPSGN